MNRVLVTGSTGYVGRSLCDFFISKGYQVLAMTRRTPDHEEQVFGVIYVQCDYQNFEILDGLGQIDTVIHLAARAHVIDNDLDRSLGLFRAANVDVTVKLARKSNDLNISRFIFISTIGVNGNYTFNDVAFNESSIPQPHSPYAVAKYEAEQQLQQLLDGRDLAFTILRLPLIYSAEAPGNFKRLLDLVSKGFPLPFGAVRNKRSMLSLQNLLDCIERCCWHEGAKGEMFLVADDQTLSTSDIIRCLAKGMNKRIWQYSFSSQIVKTALNIIGRNSMYIQLFEDLVIDNSKIKKRLQWEPVATSRASLEQSGNSYIKRQGKS